VQVCLGVGLIIYNKVMKNEILENAKFKIEDYADMKDAIYFSMLDLLTDTHSRKQDILNRIGDNMPIYEYIGYKDRNGVEIYRGDLVRINDGRLFEIVKEGLNWCMRGINSKYSSHIFTDNKGKAYVDVVQYDWSEDLIFYVTCTNTSGEQTTVKEYEANEFKTTAEAINSFVKDFCNSKHKNSIGVYFTLMCYEGNAGGGVLSEVINTNQFN